MDTAKSLTYIALPLIGLSLAYKRRKLSQFAFIPIKAFHALVHRALYPNGGLSKEMLSQARHRELLWLSNHGKEVSAELLSLLQYPETQFLNRLRDSWIRPLKGRSLFLKTSDLRKLDAVWIPAHGVKTEKTMLLFHGNAQTLDDLRFHAQFFLKEGFNVLLMTLGGYPGSSHTVPTSELTAYKDVDAALHFLMDSLKIPPSQIIAYGFSLGAALAIYAGSLANIAVIADQPFTQLSEMSESLLQNYLPSLQQKFKTVAKSLFKMTFPRHPRRLWWKKRVAHEAVLKDGYNNAQKVKELKGPLLTIGASEDLLMTYTFKGKRRNFAQDLALLHPKGLYLPLKGKHRAVFYEDPLVAKEVVLFIKQVLEKPF